MKNVASFVIEDQNFTIRLLIRDQFEVKSHPKNYSFQFEKERSPFRPIKKILGENPKNLLLIDKNILNLYGKDTDIDKRRIFTATATEEFKTLDGVAEVLSFLQKNRFTKGETLIVVGGGITQDVGAFVGSIYKRGIKWIFFPTTLLAMADSCIGGKTGINFKNGKNQLGLFCPPQKVIINSLFLTSLSPKDICCGLGEILKLHATGGKVLLKRYKNLVTKGKVLKTEDFEELILNSLLVKRAIIEKDEFEENIRRSLNYGHTIGHALETLSDYQIPHGQAIAIGMIVVNEFAYQNKLLLNVEDEKELETLLLDLLDKEIFKELRKINLNKIYDKLMLDKKTVGSILHLVILQSLGKIRFFPLKMSPQIVNDIIEIIKRKFYGKVSSN